MDFIELIRWEGKEYSLLITQYPAFPALQALVRELVPLFGIPQMMSRDNGTPQNLPEGDIVSTIHIQGEWWKSIIT